MEAQDTAELMEQKTHDDKNQNYLPRYSNRN